MECNDLIKILMGPDYVSQICTLIVGEFSRRQVKYFLSKIRTLTADHSFIHCGLIEVAVILTGECDKGMSGLDRLRGG